MNTNSKFSMWFKSILTRISPKLNTRVVYYFKFKHRIDLSNPRGLDEKIQWLKLNYYRNMPLVTQCADKFAVRQYITNCGCEEILNTLLASYDRVDDIEWEKLPNSFVIKWNFGCGQNLICRDKSTLDLNKAKSLLRSWYDTHDTFYLPYSELQYRNIKPKIIVEKLIETESGDLPIDYKLYCFHGKAFCVMMCYDRGKGAHPKYYFFTRNGELLRYNPTGKSAPSDFKLDPLPEGFDKLFHYAEIVSKPFPFVRADFYLEKGKVIFGELTFTPCGGYDVNILPDAQIELGDKVHLGCL